MASSDPNSSPLQPHEHDDNENDEDEVQTTHHNQQLRRPSFRLNSLFRSISLKEPSFSRLPLSPSRLSTCSISRPLHNFSAPSSPKPQENLIMKPTHRCICSMLKRDGPILSIAVSNGLIYTGSEANCIRVWKLPDFTESGKLKSKAGGVCSLVVANDRVFAAHVDCKIRVWQRTWDGAATHARIATVPKFGSYVLSYIAGKDKKMVKHLAPISSLAVNISDDLLYSASADKTVKVWRISDLKCIETIQAHSEPVNAVAAADDGVLYTASDDATVRVWRRNFCSGSHRPHSLTVTLPAKCSPVKALALTPDGSVLYGGCTDGYVHFWLRGWFSGQMQYGGGLRGHSHVVMSLASVANYVVSGSADLTARVWVRHESDQVHHVCAAVLQGHRGPVRCVAAFVDERGSGKSVGDGEDGCIVCTGSLDGVLKVWRVSSTTTNNDNSSSSCGRRGSSTEQGGGVEYFQL